MNVNVKKIDGSSARRSAELADGPLTGLRVLDFTTVVVGPVATRTLADYGADVIKIEAPEGDLLRKLGGASRSSANSPKFLQMNGNKRSIAIDLKSPEGQEIVQNLLKTADMIVVNMRQPALVKLNLDYESVCAVNDKIIHCTLTGYGSGGRYHGRPAYDTIIQGVGGLAACNERAGGEPRFVPLVLADHLVGLIAVQMILLALRARDLSGEAQKIEVPMYENVVRFVLEEHMGQMAFEPARGKTGDVRVLEPHSRPVQTSDGYICVSANTDKQAHALFEAIGRPELKTDTRFATVSGRYSNVAEYFSIRNEALREKSTQHWMKLLEELDVPAMPYNTLEDLFNDPHLEDVGFFSQLEHPDEGTIRRMRLPNTLSAGERRNPMPAPRLGEHNAAILSEIGVGLEEQADLAERGVIASQ